MLKKLIVVSCISFSLFAAERGSIRVPEEYAQKLAEIDHDTPLVYWGCVGAFRKGKESDGSQKPSEVFTYLIGSNDECPIANMIKGIDEVASKRAQGYLQKFVVPSFKKMDAEYDVKLTETGNVAATWQWFTEYFKDEILTKDVIAYKQQVASSGATLVALRERGVYPQPDGQTWVVDGRKIKDKDFSNL